MFSRSKQSVMRARRVTELKQWVEQVFQLSYAEAVMVSELTCTEQGGPPLETVIAILGVGTKRQYKLHKKIEEVVLEDIERLAKKAEHPV